MKDYRVILWAWNEKNQEWNRHTYIVKCAIILDAIREAWVKARKAGLSHFTDRTVSCKIINHRIPA